jgi:hypothetical protein
MRLQDIVQSLFQRVVGLSKSATLLVRGQVQGRPRVVVLVLTEACDIAEQVQQVRRHRKNGEADELPEQVLAIRRAAGLDELLDVLQPKRVGGDVTALAIASRTVAVVAIVVVMVIAVVTMVVVAVVIMVMVIAVVAMIMMMTVIPTTVTRRSGRACMSGRTGWASGTGRSGSTR